jgi:hypothetical protein
MQKTTPFKTCDIIKYHKLPQTLDMLEVSVLLDRRFIAGK